MAKDFLQACQNCILPVRKNFWQKVSSEKFCFHSLKISKAWAKLFLEFLLKKVGRLVETAFHVWRGTFWESFFQKKILEPLNIFRNWTEEFWTWTRYFQQFHQNCNLPVQKNNLIKSIFFEWITFSNLLSDFEENFFGHLPKNFRQGCQICILPLHWNVLRKQFFRREVF